MDLSELNELKEGWRMAVQYDYAFDYDTATAWLPVRDRIHDTGYIDEDIKRVDAEAVRKAVA